MIRIGSHRRADGCVRVPTRNDGFDLEYEMDAAWNREPAGWSLDDPTPTAVRFIDRHGRELVKPVLRGTLLYRLLCVWIDNDADFSELCFHASVGD